MTDQHPVILNLPLTFESDNLVVLYHGGCWDGFCAPYLIDLYGPRDAKYIPCVHGNPPPDIPHGCDLLIVDFSFPVAQMQELAKKCRTLVVLDHHQSAAIALADFKLLADPNHTYVYFDMARSGGRILWEHMVRSLDLRGPIPWIVAYTEDRDLWKHALPHSQEINAVLRSYPLDLTTWAILSQSDPLKLVEAGAAIRRREQLAVQEHVRKAAGCKVGGLEALAVNATDLFSEIAGELAKKSPVGACYFRREDGLIVFSLRSTAEGPDVSKIAQQYGGGGHPRAAGFQLPVEQAFALLDGKELVVSRDR